MSRALVSVLSRPVVVASDDHELLVIDDSVVRKLCILDPSQDQNKERVRKVTYVTGVLVVDVEVGEHVAQSITLPCGFKSTIDDR